MQKENQNKIFYVYQLRVEDENQPFYIGKGKLDRVKDHFLPKNLKKFSHKNNKIKQAQNNQKKVLIEFLRENITDRQAQRLEKFWIAKIGRVDLGLGSLTNNTNGGEGTAGRIVSDETRELVSKNMIERYKTHDHPLLGKSHSDESKAKMSSSLKGRYGPRTGLFGENNPCFGQIRDSESRSNIYNGIRNQPKLICPHCNTQYSKRVANRFHFDKCKSKPGNEDLKHFSEEVCNKTALRNSKNFKVKSPDGVMFEGSNLKKFCEDQQLNYQQMRLMCSGQLKYGKHKGWSGEYV